MLGKNLISSHMDNIYVEIITGTEELLLLKNIMSSTKPTSYESLYKFITYYMEAYHSTFSVKDDRVSFLKVIAFE